MCVGASATGACTTCCAKDFPGVNHKRVCRLYSAANLAVRKRKKAKRPVMERTPLQRYW